jgi:hypothetical protein
MHKRTEMPTRNPEQASNHIAEEREVNLTRTGMSPGRASVEGQSKHPYSYAATWQSERLD